MQTPTHTSAPPACRYETLARVSGVAAPSRKALKQLMDGDFDPEQWDRHMQDTFDDEYYAAPESEDAVREDEAGLAKEMSSWGDAAAADAGATDTFAALHARVTGSAAVELPETDYDQHGAAVADRPVVDESADEGGATGTSESGSDAKAGDVSGEEGEGLSAEDQTAHKDKVRGGTLLFIRFSIVCLECRAHGAQQLCLGTVAQATTDTHTTVAEIERLFTTVTARCHRAPRY